MNTAETQTADGSLKERAKPTVFLSYPFVTRNDWIKHCVPRLLELWGCKVLSGERYYGREIKKEVANDIARSKLLVAFLTRHQELAGGNWTTSGWVLQETGFACGKDIPVVLIGESGVEVKGGILGDIQVIELDAEKEAYWALPQLRSAIKDLLFEHEPDEELAVCHLAKLGRKDKWGRQWWDFWLWIDGSEDTLSSVSEVKYELPDDFDPQYEEGAPHQAFGSYSETDAAVDVRVKLRLASGTRKVVRHRVTLQGAGITRFAG
jgi:hypothetical protein